MLASDVPDVIGPPRLLRDLALVTVYRSISGDRRQALSHSLRQNSNSDHYRGGAYSSGGNYASAFDKRDAEGWRQRLGGRHHQCQLAGATSWEWIDGELRHLIREPRSKHEIMPLSSARLSKMGMLRSRS